jgi:hypothetical protein
MGKQKKFVPKVPLRANIDYDRYPDCVAITPYGGKIQGGKSDICFEITFGEHRQTTSVGDLQFGVSGGVLSLVISNGIVQQQDIEYLNMFNPSTNVEALDRSSAKSGRQGEQNGGLEVELSANPSIKAGISPKRNRSREQEQGAETTYSTSIEHIRANWHPVEPWWRFTHRLRDLVLRGRLKTCRFATITLQTPPTTAKYEFKVNPKDIVFTEVPIILEASTINKRKVLAIAITKYLKIPRIFNRGSFGNDE